VFIKNNIIKVTEKAFDDFANTGSNEEFNRRILGIH
jgi:isocitrate dehydrogenase